MKPKTSINAHNGVRLAKRGWHATTGKPPRRGKGSATVEPLRTRQDIERIKQALADRPRDLALFTVGIHFGLRGGDLLSLRWSDVLGPRVQIKQTVEIHEQKTGNHRRIAVSEPVRRALHDWHKLARLRDSELIFPNAVGEKLTLQRLHQLVNEWADSATVHGHFGSHTLRKTYGYFLHQQGTDLALLMRVFGHSSQAITLRYIGIEQQHIDEANLSLAL